MPDRDELGPGQRRAVLDLGSNSFHVLIADVFEDGTVVPVGREREMLHLGAVVERHGHVPDAERDHAIATAAHLTELARRLGATTRSAVATSALRDASNGRDVTAAMAEACGVPIQIIDGETEARLSYLGVRASIATDADPLLVLDLGGGSLEFALGSGLDVTTAHSVNLGVSRLSALVERDPLGKRERAQLISLIHERLDPVATAVRAAGPDRTVIVGGTLRALARVIAAERHDWLPATLNQYELSTKRIVDLAERLRTMTLDERLELPDLKSRRADRIHIAALVLAETLTALGIDRVTLSDWGLREGVLLDELGACPTIDRVTLRVREAKRLRRTFVPDDPHLEHVADLTVALFDGTQELHGRSPDDRNLLWCAAALHDVGETLALRRHHHHGAYLVQHAELRGFSPRDTAILCSVVRFHKSRGCSTSYPPFAALGAGDRRRTEQFVALLQLADGLDRARDQAVMRLGVEVETDKVVVHLHGSELHTAREEFDRKTAFFERVFTLPVSLAD